MTKRTALIWAELVRMGPMANQELAEHLDLSPASITQIVRPLVKSGVLIELDPSNYRAERLRETDSGIKKRRKITLTPNPDLGYALCASFRGRTLSFQKVGFDLRPDEGFQHNLDLKLDDEVSSQIRDALRSIMDKDPRALLALGFSVSGRVDPTKGEVLYSTNLPYLIGLDLGRSLSLDLGAPCVILNDSHAISVGERFSGEARDTKHFITLFIDEGVGMGIFIDGKAYQGHENLAGEAGQTILHPQGRKHHGIVDGSFEAYVSQGAIWDRLQGLNLPGRVLDAGPDQAYPLFLDLIQRKDPEALKILDDIADKLGLLCTNLGLLLSPELIFIAGWLAGAGASLLERIQRSMLAYGPPGMRESLAGRVRLREDFAASMTLGTAKAGFEAYLNFLDQQD